MNLKSTALLGGCIILAAVILAVMLRPEPPPEASRFQLIQSDGGYVVLDTRTGEVREHKSVAKLPDTATWNTASAGPDWQKNAAQQWRIDPPKVPAKPPGM